jgi:acyl carrier protein
MGRADEQVKVRGHRVEPGEVEVALSAHPGVGAAAVVARGDGHGGWLLAAYVVGQGGAAPAVAGLREHLRERLPEHMIPSSFTVLDAFPLTPSGKVDRRALPEPGRGDAPGHQPVPPRTDTERALAEIWAGLLKVERVGADDHFFLLGGQSLAAMRLVLAIRARLELEVPLRVLYDTPVLADQAARLDAIRDAEIDHLMAELDAMSDDEVRAALAREEA